jgi:hypothetical protein
MSSYDCTSVFCVYSMVSDIRLLHTKKKKGAIRDNTKHSVLGNFNINNQSDQFVYQQTLRPFHSFFFYRVNITFLHTAKRILMCS